MCFKEIKFRILQQVLQLLQPCPYIKGNIIWNLFQPDPSHNSSPSLTYPPSFLTTILPTLVKSVKHQIRCMIDLISGKHKVTLLRQVSPPLIPNANTLWTDILLTLDKDEEKNDLKNQEIPHHYWQIKLSQSNTL